MQHSTALADPSWRYPFQSSPGCVNVPGYVPWAELGDGCNNTSNSASTAASTTASTAASTAAVLNVQWVFDSYGEGESPGFPIGSSVWVDGLPGVGGGVER